MSTNNDIVRVLKDRQCAMRRELDRRGMSLKAISFDSGIPYSTLLSYFPEQGGRDPALMPVSAQYMLAEKDAVPADILSLLLPTGKLIVRVPAEIDHYEATKAMQDYIATKDDFHHPESECGEAIGPNEDNVLRGKFAKVRAA